MNTIQRCLGTMTDGLTSRLTKWRVTIVESVFILLWILTISSLCGLIWVVQLVSAAYTAVESIIKTRAERKTPNIYELPLTSSERDMTPLNYSKQSMKLALVPSGFTEHSSTATDDQEDDGFPKVATRSGTLR